MHTHTHISTSRVCVFGYVHVSNPCNADNKPRPNGNVDCLVSTSIFAIFAKYIWFIYGIYMYSPDSLYTVNIVHQRIPLCLRVEKGPQTCTLMRTCPICHHPLLLLVNIRYVCLWLRTFTCMVAIWLLYVSKCLYHSQASDVGQYSSTLKLNCLISL